MGLFDLFKNQKDETQEAPPAIPLEIALQNAATEPSSRPAFYQTLMNEGLIVLTQESSIGNGEQKLEKDTSISIISYPDGRIPVFSSPDRIFDKGVIKEEMQYVAMKGEDLFRLTKGATLILNPYSDYGKELLPPEIESMLDGTILTQGQTQLTVQEETQVLLAQPAKYPTEIVEALQKLFASKQHIKAAYLGWIHNPASADPPHYIFAVDGEGDMQQEINEAGFLANQYLPAGDIVDFVRISDGDNISEYFTGSTTPFYTR